MYLSDIRQTIAAYNTQKGWGRALFGDQDAIQKLHDFKETILLRSKNEADRQLSGKELFYLCELLLSAKTIPASASYLALKELKEKFGLQKLLVADILKKENLWFLENFLLMQGKDLDLIILLAETRDRENSYSSLLSLESFTVLMRQPVAALRESCKLLTYLKSMRLLNKKTLELVLSHLNYVSDITNALFFLAAGKNLNPGAGLGDDLEIEEIFTNAKYLKILFSAFPAEPFPASCNGISKKLADGAAILRTLEMENITDDKVKTAISKMIFCEGNKLWQGIFKLVCEHALSAENILILCNNSTQADEIAEILIKLKHYKLTHYMSAINKVTSPNEIITAIDVIKKERQEMSIENFKIILAANQHAVPVAHGLIELEKSNLGTELYKSRLLENPEHALMIAKG